MKQKYVDICLKVDGSVRLLVEAKSADLKLRERHIEQAELYASRNNYRWVLLTNGVEWNLYHLTFEEGIEYECAFSVSLEDVKALEEPSEKLALLHKMSIRKGELEAFWEKASALSPASIGKSLFNESVLKLLRREIRKDTGLLIDSEDLAAALYEMLSAESMVLIGRPRIRKKRRIKRDPKAKFDVSAVGESPQIEGGDSDPSAMDAKPCHPQIKIEIPEPENP